jgi:hypothetical protein
MSRGLDAQIARDVFGWTDIQLREDVGAIGIPPRDDGGHTVPFWVEKCQFYIVPEYSGDSELAGSVLAKMYHWDYPAEDWAHYICLHALIAVSLEKLEKFMGGNDGK